MVGKRIVTTVVLKCSRCKRNFHKSNFHKNSTCTRGRDHYCKQCRIVISKGRDKEKSRLYGKKYITLNKDKIRNKGYLHSFNITIEQYNKLLEKQSGICAICLKKECTSDKKNLSVDHNHSTGYIRGLLCRKCNLGLGNFNDDIVLLFRAIDYLAKSLEAEKLLRSNNDKPEAV